MGGYGPGIVTSHELLRILPLVSAALWLGIGARALVRRDVRSPFEQAIVAFVLLLGLWALLDWIVLGTTDAELAVAISNVRITLITFATFALLLGMKWLHLGHSRRDPLLAVPVIGSLAIVWTGLTSDVDFVSWGPRLVRDPLLYALWAGQQVAYVGASIVFGLALFLGRRDMPKGVRRRAGWTGGSLLVLLALWLATNIYNNVTQTAGVPWFSSALLIPGAIVLVAYRRVPAGDINAFLRAVSEVQKNVRAVYLFHETGEPLVALASGATFPIEAERLQGILAAVGGFLERSVDVERGYGVTGLRFDEQGVVAVRARHLIAAALYDGNVYDAVRSDLVRNVRKIEEEHWSQLGTWEQATKIAEAAAGELSALLHKPTRTAPRTRPMPMDA